MKKQLSQTALISLAMVFALLLSGIITAAQTRRHVEDSLVRLHILADSDSEEDQALKLMVRDALLQHSDELFAPYQSHDEAVISLEKNMDRIKEIADDTLAANGSTDTVSCEIEHIQFDTRVYDGFTVPEGDYTALRIKIGSGEGHNWWCVMYPPLCVPCAGGIDEEIIEKYGTELTDEDIILLTECGDFEIRLYFVDKIKELLSDDK